MVRDCLFHHFIIFGAAEVLVFENLHQKKVGPIPNPAPKHRYIMSLPQASSAITINVDKGAGAGGFQSVRNNDSPRQKLKYMTTKKEKVNGRNSRAQGQSALVQ